VIIDTPPDILGLLAIITVAIVLMTTEMLRADVVALLLAVTLVLAGIITPEEAFSGFSRTAVITILAVFIMAHGLYRTGVTRRVGLALQRLAGDRPLLLLLFTMLGGATLSLFMQNIAAAAVLMPALMDVARRTRTNPSKLLMPLAFGVNLGGMATLLATANILVGTTLQDLGLTPYGLLDFAPLGLPLIAVGVLYMLVVGHRLLPAVNPTEKVGRIQRLQKELCETYALEERLREVYIPSKSPLVGKSIEASQIGEKLGLSVLAVCRDGLLACIAPSPDQIFDAEDTLLIEGRDERVQQLTGMGAEVLEATDWSDSLSTEQIVLLEVILAPRSNAASHTLKELRFREKYGLSVVALWRGGRPYRTDVGDMRLNFGDALLVHGPREAIAVLRTDPDFLVLAEPAVPPRTRKGWLAAIIMALTLAAAAFNLLPIAVAMMLGALGMVVTGCLTMDEAYRSVEWPVIFLIAGMLPIGVALSRSGAAEWLGQLLVSALAGWGPLAVAGGILLLTTLLTQVMSGQVTAVVLTPIAVAAARQVEADPRAIAMAVAMGCGMVFMTPTSHPVNVFVMGPGGYRFRDFLRVGLPLTVLLFLTVLVVLPLFWPLG
jgi:di/tricarboxylate transporter